MIGRTEKKKKNNKKNNSIKIIVGILPLEVHVVEDLNL